jgi:hypothetical protein
MAGAYGQTRYKVYLHELTSLRLTAFPKHVLAPGATFGEAEAKWSNGASIGVWRDHAGLQLAFAVNGEERRQTIALVHRPRHFGGCLATMLCPRCCRSVRALYCWRGRFVCRLCTPAIYRSKTRDKARAAQTQYQKLRARIRPGTEDYGLNYFPRRRKGMRRVTYTRLHARADAKLNRYHEHLDAGLFRVLARIAPDALSDLLSPKIAK